MIDHSHHVSSCFIILLNARPTYLDMFKWGLHTTNRYQTPWLQFFGEAVISGIATSDQPAPLVVWKITWVLGPVSKWVINPLI